MAASGTTYADEAEEPLITDINVTPLVDIVLVLLIVFMITMPVIVTLDAIRERELKGSLAKIGEAVPLISKPQELVVEIAPDGKYTVGNQPLSESDLLQLLQRMDAANPGRSEVQVLPDRSCSWEHVARVVALLQRANIRSYRFGASE